MYGKAKVTTKPVKFYFVAKDIMMLHEEYNRLRSFLNVGEAFKEVLEKCLGQKSFGGYPTVWPSQYHRSFYWDSLKMRSDDETVV